MREKNLRLIFFGVLQVYAKALHTQKFRVQKLKCINSPFGILTWRKKIVMECLKKKKIFKATRHHTRSKTKFKKFFNILSRVCGGEAARQNMKIQIDFLGH